MTTGLYKQVLFEAILSGSISCGMGWLEGSRFLRNASTNVTDYTATPAVVNFFF